MNLIRSAAIALMAMAAFSSGWPALNSSRLVAQTTEPSPYALALPANESNGHKIVLLAGDEEYRSEESLPMLGKILSQRHGFDCTVLFSLSADKSYIDPNNQSGIGGLEALDDADLLIVATRFRRPTAEQAKHVQKFIEAGKPVIGLRTATHAFTGQGNFGNGISYDQFGRKILGEQWVNHHGGHKVQGTRSIPAGSPDRPVLKGIEAVFGPSDVYGVIHLTEADDVVLLGQVTESLHPESKIVQGGKNEVLQPLAWFHEYETGKGTKGRAFCTTAGASVDFVDDDLRRLVVNAAYELLDLPVPDKADVRFVDAFYPTFYGFIQDPNFWKSQNRQPSDFALGKTPSMQDPPGSPQWPFRPTPDQDSDAIAKDQDSDRGQRIAMVGNSLSERMNLFGNFEALVHTRSPESRLVIRNFGWPADEVANRQRPGSYTEIDDPLEVFAPQKFLCFYGFNESYKGVEGVETFKKNYLAYLSDLKKRFAQKGQSPEFVLISPIAFEYSGEALQPDGRKENENLALYTEAIRQLAQQEDIPFVDLFTETQKAFASETGLQFTVNGVHVNDQGDRLVATLLDAALNDSDHPKGLDDPLVKEVRKWVKDKSWFHLQDYRMLNGWYVYGGRRTWDTETFPVEYRKIRKMVDVRDRYIWDLAAGKSVPEQPDDSETGDVFIPETMFGSRDDNFRRGREPEVLKYPTPEESIAMMSVPEGFEVQLFASEREFPELANPNQLAWDNQGRLWVSCMVNYPQWLPGAPKPTDRLLIFEDTDNDGRADKCTPFYDKLICPTGFEFWNGGVLVVDEPRILFLKDTDGDDKADVVEHLVDGIATDDTHHTVGAWEYSHGGLLHMLEGVSMSTTLETPWGPFRNKGTAGCYILDPRSWKIRHFITPGYGNPWCLVFDNWGNTIVGDGTNAQQHWASPLSGLEVPTRKTLRPVFDNQGMRPAVGNEFLISRHLPDDIQGQFFYSCVINMHGMPRFTVADEEDGAGFVGERIDDLISSTDMIFRPVDGKIGPDGAIWFGDWCNALIGHMQYSQRDPNRDHEHGRIYRMVNKTKPLIEPETQLGKSIPELLDQLMSYELRTRYRARRELRDRPKRDVYTALSSWLTADASPQQLCEAMWIQESFRDIDAGLLKRILQSDDFHARSAAVHSMVNEHERLEDCFPLLQQLASDPHPRVRLEVVRGLSFFPTEDALKTLLAISQLPRDYWIDYTLEHSLHAMEPVWKGRDNAENFLAEAPEEHRAFFKRYRNMTGPGGAAVEPLEIADDVDQPQWRRDRAMERLAGIGGGNASRGQAVFKNVCSACHQVGDLGKKFGPNLSDVGARYNKQQLIKSIIMPNDTISKGYETVLLLMLDGTTHTGFILDENDENITLGISDGKTVTLAQEDIDARKEMKASSMPEGLIKTIAPIEFLDLVEYLKQQDGIQRTVEDGWIGLSYETPLPLREKDGQIEVSRDAKLKIGDDYPANWSQESHLFLSPVKPTGFDFTFHSQHDAKHPAVTIQLPAAQALSSMELVNRLNSQFHSRADGLTVWTSMDGQQWNKVWTAEQPAPNYQVKFPEGTTAKFVKIGLEPEGTFHLYQAVIYGPKAN